MSETPRTDNFFAQTITMNETDSASGWLSLSTELETELAEKDKQLAEARAEIERLRSRNKMLDTAIAEMTEEQAALCAEEQSITELVAAKDKLIEQMREALESIKCRLDVGNCSERSLRILDKIVKAALAAERGE